MLAVIIETKSSSGIIARTSTESSKLVKATAMRYVAKGATTRIMLTMARKRTSRPPRFMARPGRLCTRSNSSDLGAGNIRSRGSGRLAVTFSDAFPAQPVQIPLLPAGSGWPHFGQSAIGMFPTSGKRAMATLSCIRRNCNRSITEITAPGADIPTCFLGERRAVRPTWEGAGARAGRLPRRAYARALAWGSESARHEIAAKCKEPQVLRRINQNGQDLGRAGRRRSEGNKDESEYYQIAQRIDQTTLPTVSCRNLPGRPGWLPTQGPHRSVRA